MLRPPALAPFALLLLLVVALHLSPPAAHAATPDERAHELGWLCVNVSDVAVSQVSAFNKDAPSLSIWVPKARFHIEPSGPGTAGRICIPTVVRLGDGPLPPETLVFERTVIAGQVHRPSTAELVVTPESPHLAEVTIELIGLGEQWTQRDGTLTFQSLRPVTFPERVSRGLVGDGEGPAPPDVFVAMAAAQRFSEPCRPAELAEAAIANFGNLDARSGKVVARGIEPFRLEAGTKVTRCDDLALDTMTLAVARPASDLPDETRVNWYLVPRTTALRPLDPPPDSAPAPDGAPPRAYTVQRPLGGYHVCRQPTWTTSLLADVPLSGLWELLPSGQWHQNLPGDPGAIGQLDGGQGASLLDYRETWALVRVELDGRPRTLAVPASSVAMPSGPGPAAIELDGGLCPVTRGQWKALKANAQAFKVSQDTPGAELAGLWLEVPMGTHVLELCQDGAQVGGKTMPGMPACEPIIVGGAQGRETDRFVLVRYAGTFLGIRQADLRDRTTGLFELRRERPWFYRAGAVITEDEPSWALTLGPGARISFVRPKDHGWVISLYLQRLLDSGWGFEGGIGAGGDGFSTFLSFTGGAGALIHRFEDEPLELRGAVLGQLDVRVSDGGGLNFDVIGKLQLRWVNEIAPVSLELGLNVGYGGTFGDKGKGGALFGMPINLMVELAHF